MNDDWRVRTDLHVEGVAHELLEHVEAIELQHDLSTSFDDRVVVSRDGAEVFCYAGTQEQAEGVERLIGSLAAEHGWQVESELRRWHPTAEDWEDPETPMPESEAERARERATLMQREREETERRGYPDFEVRVECASHHDAVELAERLHGEGVRTVRRSRYLLIGAADEDTANALAERLRGEVPDGNHISVEGTGRAAYESRPPNPFAIFGGLAG